MKREIAELFAEVERLNEKVQEMLAERDDAMHKMFNGEISEKELKAINKACTEASKAWKQAANIALIILSPRRSLKMTPPSTSLTYFSVRFLSE